MSDDPAMTVIYDGDCPFCASYVTLMNLRKAVGRVKLVDARSGDPIVADVQRTGLDLNEGMVAIYGGKTYYGSDALALITALSNDGGPPQRLLKLLLKNPTRARLLYPAMRGGRRIALRLLGKKPIPSMSG